MLKIQGITMSKLLQEAAETIQKLGCTSYEAEEITGFCRHHLLRMHRNNDKRIKSVTVWREVIFDRKHLETIKKRCKL